MSGVLARIVELFVEADVAPRVVATDRPPVVAVLCRERFARPAAAVVGLALAHASGEPCALVAHRGGAASGIALPAARRAAAELGRHGYDASAAGRLVWLASRAARLADHDDDVGGRAAASVELARASALARLPAAIAICAVRSAPLDRVLAWHDAIVAIREPGSTDAVVERVTASLAELGRPVLVADVPSRRASSLATHGLAAPRSTLDALARLGDREEALAL